MTKYLGSFPDLGSGGSRLLHPDARGEDITLSDDLIANDITALATLIAPYLAAGTNPASAGPIRIPNNVMQKARNAANSADLDLIGTNSSNALLLSSGLTGLVKAVSSVITATTLVNADVSASADIDLGKLNVPYALFHLTASQSLTSGAEPAISWVVGGQDANDGPMWASGNPTRFTVPTGQGGLYAIMGQIAYAASSGGTRRLAEIYKNGSAYLNYYMDLPSRGASLDTQVQVTRLAFLTAGDYIELRAFQDSGGALNAVSTSNGTFLGMWRVG